MRRYCLLLFLFTAALSVSLYGSAKDKPPVFKSAEIKHFPNAEGVELPPEFGDFLYAELKTELQKAKLCEQVIGEGEVVEAADAPQSAVIEGTVLEYKKGSVVKEKLIGFGAGLRSLVAHVTVTRRSNKESLLDKDIKVRVSSTADPKHLARFLAKQIANEMKHQLKPE